MQRFLAFLTVVAALAAAACSSDELPTTPTTTTATAVITPASTVYQIGATQTFTLSASTTPTNVTWSSSDPTVMTIDGSGNATAIKVGTATISSTADNSLSATLAVQVVPTYQGNWTGTARILACTD